MNVWDTINASFEMLAVFMIVPTILRTLKTRVVIGVHWLTPMFFMIWSWWNLFWYPHLGQFWSFAAAIVFAVLNSAWFFMVYFLTPKEPSN